MEWVDSQSAGRDRSRPAEGNRSCSPISSDARRLRGQTGLLAADVIIVVRLPVLVDVIAIAARIAVILPPVHDRSQDAAQDRARDRAFAEADAGARSEGNTADLQSLMRS